MPTGFQVRVDHLDNLHLDWVKQNDDGTAELTIPADTSRRGSAPRLPELHGTVRELRRREKHLR